jgi:hypothetical protein
MVEIVQHYQLLPREAVVEQVVIHHTQLQQATEDLVAELDGIQVAVEEEHLKLVLTAQT